MVFRFVFVVFVINILLFTVLCLPIFVKDVCDFIFPSSCLVVVGLYTYDNNRQVVSHLPLLLCRLSGLLSSSVLLVVYK